VSRILTITADASSVTLECLGEPDAVYDVERADDDVVNLWNPIDTQTAASDGTFFSTDFAPPTTAAFYRLRKQ
jgi:hypothetical protein